VESESIARDGAAKPVQQRLSTASTQTSHSLHTTFAQPTIVIYRALIPPLQSRGRSSPAIYTLSVVLIFLPAFLRTDIRAMRLLHLDRSERLTSTDFSGKTIPPYAILSHTWDGDEFLFEDLVNETGKSKASYKKILFYGEQAARDHLQYF
jgi:hypothetical protein